MARGTALETPAIVVRVVPFAETSQVVHLATPQHGLVPALAKGALRPTADFQGGLTLGAFGTARLAHRRGAELEILRGFRTQEAWRRARESLERIAAVCYVIELLRTWLRPGLPIPALFRAALVALHALDRAPAGATGAWVVWFEARALAATGHRPRLDACAACDRAVTSDGWFSPAAGGICHASCAPEGPRRRLGPSALAALDRVYTARVSQWAAEPLDERAVAQVRAVHDLYLPAVLERRPQGLAGVSPVRARGRR
jgi:DNA repair protein RecO (recombination protein O)